MSKSLKNLITIRKWVVRHNSRQIHLSFLAHHSDVPMNYAKHVIEKALNLGQAFIAFYCTSEATLREIGKNLKTRTVRPNILELERSAELNRRQEKHHTYILGDNFDTPPALLEL